MFGDLDIDHLVQVTFLLIALVASTTEPHTLHASSDTNYIDFSISKYLYDLPWNSHPMVSRKKYQYEHRWSVVTTRWWIGVAFDVVLVFICGIHQVSWSAGLF